MYTVVFDQVDRTLLVWQHVFGRQKTVRRFQPAGEDDEILGHHGRLVGSGTGTLSLGMMVLFEGFHMFSLSTFHL